MPPRRGVGAARGTHAEQEGLPPVLGWREGDRCEHSLHGSGVVRYVGPMENEGSKLWVGVELDRRRSDGAAGHADGSAFGTRYFHCPPGHGVMFNAEKPKGKWTRLSQSRPHSSRPAGLPTGEGYTGGSGGRRRDLGMGGPSATSDRARVSPHARLLSGVVCEPEPAWRAGGDRRYMPEPEPEPEPEPGPGPRQAPALSNALMEHAWTAAQSVDPAAAAADFVGLDGLMRKHGSQLGVLKEWAKQGWYDRFDSAHFDWWMFPINEPSRHGMLYTLPSRDQAELSMAVPEFRRDFRTGVGLVTKAWGWDLKRRCWMHPRPSRWTGRPIRLYKMGRCARMPARARFRTASHGFDAWRRSVMLFGQADLFESLQLLVRELRAAGERLSVKHGLLGPADILDLWGP